MTIKMGNPWVKYLNEILPQRLTPLHVSSVKGATVVGIKQYVLCLRCSPSYIEKYK